MPNLRLPRRWKPDAYVLFGTTQWVRWPFGPLNLSSLEDQNDVSWRMLQDMRVSKLRGWYGNEQCEWDAKNGWTKGVLKHGSKA